jgi:hypothetical protein
MRQSTSLHLFDQERSRYVQHIGGFDGAKFLRHGQHHDWPTLAHMAKELTDELKGRRWHLNGWPVAGIGRDRNGRRSGVT